MSFSKAPHHTISLHHFRLQDTCPSRFSQVAINDSRNLGQLGKHLFIQRCHRSAHMFWQLGPDLLHNVSLYKCLNKKIWEGNDGANENATQNNRNQHWYLTIRSWVRCCFEGLGSWGKWNDIIWRTDKYADKKCKQSSIQWVTFQIDPTKKRIHNSQYIFIPESSKGSWMDDKGCLYTIP